MIAADMPVKPKGFLALVGPGAVLAGLAVGAGELVVWPIMTARFGAAIAWGAVLGVALQLVINVEVGRYTLASGESAYGAIARLSRRWVPIFLLLNVAGWLLPGWARTCAGAIKAMAVGVSGPGEPWLWTALTFVLVGAVLFGPRRAYAWVEAITITLVGVMLVGLTVIAAKVATWEAAADLARGAISFGRRPPELPAYEMFSAIVFAGAGGTTNLMLSYYLREKRWGMCAHDEASALSMSDSEENRRRWRSWLRHLAVDQAVFFWLTNTVTIMLFVLAALVVLHPAGIVPEREMLIVQEAAILERVWGKPGAYLFMVVGIACLFSTQLTLLDGVARSIADLVHGNYPAARRFTALTWYRGTALGWMVAGTALTWLWSSLPPFVFLLSAGFFGGIAMAVYCPLLLVANTRLIARPCRPGMVARGAFGAVSLFYVAFALTSLWVITRAVVLA